MIITDATSLPRLMACIGSRRLIDTLAETISRPNSTSRDEGNAVHWAVEQIVSNHGVPPSENTKAPNGLALTADMITHAIDYIECVREAFSEYEVNTSLSGNGWRINGRADHIAYDSVNGVLQIDDLKYGWTIVEPDMNWTLIFHAIGYCLNRKVEPRAIRISIHQPRPFHPDGPVRSWEIDYQQLMTYWLEIVDKMASADDTLVSGPQCRKCPALATCPAARRAALNAIDLSTDVYSEELSSLEISRELDLLNRAAAMIKDRLDMLQNAAMYRLGKGDVINNYALERGMSNSRWKEGLTPDILLAITGQSVAQSKLVTPAEAKRRGISADVIAALTERVPTDLKLVRIDPDKRARRLLKGKS